MSGDKAPARQPQTGMSHDLADKLDFTEVDSFTPAAADRLGALAGDDPLRMALLRSRTLEIARREFAMPVLPDLVDEAASQLALAPTGWTQADPSRKKPVETPIEKAPVEKAVPAAGEVGGKGPGPQAAAARRHRQSPAPPPAAAPRPRRRAHVHAAVWAAGIVLIATGAAAYVAVEAGYVDDERLLDAARSTVASGFAAVIGREQMGPEQAVPEQAVPEQAVPEQAVPEQAVETPPAAAVRAPSSAPAVSEPEVELQLQSEPESGPEPEAEPEPVLAPQRGPGPEEEALAASSPSDRPSADRQADPEGSPADPQAADPQAGSQAAGRSSDEGTLGPTAPVVEPGSPATADDGGSAAGLTSAGVVAKPAPAAQPATPEATESAEPAQERGDGSAEAAAQSEPPEPSEPSITPVQPGAQRPPDDVGSPPAEPDPDAASAPEQRPQEQASPPPGPETERLSAPLIERGNRLLELGDVASARLFYRLAADRGSAEGAMLMGMTFDPVYFARSGILGTPPSIADAVQWYRKAIAGGSAGAERRMQALRSWLEQAAESGDAEAKAALEKL